MYNIKQKFIKFIISFIWLLSFSSCQTAIENTKIPARSNKIIETDGKVEVAILMPLSGELGDLGREYTKLIKMGITDGLQGQINLTIYDSADETLASTSVEKLIAKNTKIILGPLTSPITSTIAQRVKAAGIIMVTLSNNPILADNKLLVFGHAPLKQLLPLTNYFLGEKYTNFITLLPTGSHSYNTSKIIQNLVVKNNGMLVKAEFYSPNQNSIERAVKVVSDSVTNLAVSDSDHPPVVILGGEDSAILTMLFNSIRIHNLDKRTIIAGDNKLDFYYPEDINIIYSGSLNSLNSNLKNKAREENISHITFMHALAYDLGKMTATFIGEKFNEQHFLNQINSPLGYIGTSGKIKFIDGIAIREYDIIKRVGRDYETLWSISQK